MSEERNIVVLGGGFAGLGMAHYTLKHTMPALQARDKTATYKVVLVDQSTHFWYHIAAPRTMVNSSSLPHSKTFQALDASLKQYPAETWVVKQGAVSGLDLSGRTVTITSPQSTTDAEAVEERLPFYALVIATGTHTPTTLTSLHGPHTASIAALDAMNAKLKTASSVVISGGGPVAVESAGEIAEALVRQVSAKKVTITLVTAADRLLPKLSAKRADKAATMLKSMGVTIRYKARVSGVQEPSTTQTNSDITSSEKSASQSTTIELDNGESLTADVYIPATGATPNSKFMPESLVDKRGYIKTVKGTLRLDAPDTPRVYVVGDVSTYTGASVLDHFAAVPVAGANLARDLGVGRVTSDKVHKADMSETQIVPLGSKKGVGAFKGHSFPGFMVSKFKGQDYMIRYMPDTTLGNKYKKP